jgi:Domain of unknown function (DUF1937)
MSETNLPSRPDWTHPDVEFFSGSLLQRDATLSDVVDHSRGRLAYLATPYSKIALSNNAVWDYSASMVAMTRAARWARLLGIEGVTAISPIIQSVEMVNAGVSLSSLTALDPLDARFWENWCRPLLAKADVVIVPPIHGWAESAGIWIEVCTALLSSRRVYLIKPGEGLEGVA